MVQSIGWIQLLGDVDFLQVLAAQELVLALPSACVLLVDAQIPLFDRLQELIFFWEHFVLCEDRIHPDFVVSFALLAFQLGLLDVPDDCATRVCSLRLCLPGLPSLRQGVAGASQTVWPFWFEFQW